MAWRLFKPFVFLALFISLVGTACLSSSSTSTQPAGKQDSPSTEESTSKPEPKPSSAGKVTDLDGVQNATIQILAEGTSVDPEQGTQLNAGWSGSGFFIDDTGLAVTNNHVVTGAAILKVYIGGDTTPYSAQVVAVSECADLAVIKVKATDFNYLSWYDGSIKVGTEVYAAGFPLGEPEFNLTKGIVSKNNADGQTSWSSLDTVIGHDATINPGNSGGPLITPDGEVVGVNYRGRSESNQYFAISAEIAKNLVDELKNGKNIDSVGVNGEAFSFGPNSEYPGIWVYSVETGSPADQSGVKAGDIILEMEGILLATDGTFKQYCDVLRGHQSDETMSIRVYRPSTDEILEGQLNGRTLEATGFGGLTSGNGSTTGDTPAGGTSDLAVIDTEFDTDFTQEGWSSFVLGDDSDYMVQQKPGRAYVRVNTDDTTVYVVNDNFWATDARVEVREQKVEGPNRMNVSLVCRASSDGWYEFSITSGGYWQIWKYNGASGTFSQLKTGASNAIAVQKGSNMLQATCIGDTLTFLVNEKKVGEATDRDFTEGQVGFSVSTFDLTGAGVEFEYFYADKGAN